MPFLRLVRQRLVEVRRSNCDVVDTLSLPGEEARVVALLVERLDQLPLHPADHGVGSRWQGRCRFAVGAARHQPIGGVYGITFDVTALTFDGVWQYARRHGLLSDEVDPAGAAAVSRRFQLP